MITSNLLIACLVVIVLVVLVFVVAVVAVAEAVDDRRHAKKEREL